MFQSIFTQNFQVDLGSAPLFLLNKKSFSDLSGKNTEISEKESGRGEKGCVMFMEISWGSESSPN